RTFIQRPQEFHIIRGPFLELAYENGIAPSFEPFDPNLYMPKVLSIFDEIWKTHYDESLNKSKRVFCKEHSVCFLRFTLGTTILSSPHFLEMTHTFLIRNPEKSVKSLYKAKQFLSKANTEFSAKGFDKNSVGLEESKQIFDLLKDLNKQLIVVDADDLVNDPERILKKYCELIGEEFKEEMTHWEAKPVKEWGDANAGDGISKFMIHNAENSTGFNKFTDKHDAEIEFPQIVYDTIEENKP
ncbi:7581_t:CDS:2, partial [Racocetra persica]